MKKIFLLIILGSLFVSCKKEYTCECTFYYNNGTIGNVYQTVFKENSKSKALQKCSDKENPQTSGSNYTVCYLQ